MKALISLVLGFCLLTSVVNAASGPFQEIDKEAKEIADFIGAMMGPEIVKQYPTANIEWGGRAMASESADALYLIYCEVTEPKKGPIYFYFEFSLTSINDKPELLQKYKL